MGTAFLACEESGASALHRSAILGENARRTGLTRGLTGRLARGIQNQLLEGVNRLGVEILPFPSGALRADCSSILAAFFV